MTCIVGLKHDNRIYIGSDSCSTLDGWCSRETLVPKIFFRNDYLFGVSGTFRANQILEHIFDPPEISTGDTTQFMIKEFIPKLQYCFERNDFRGQQWYALVAYNKELFTVYNDFQVQHYSDDFTAIGGGYDLAIGSLRTMTDYLSHFSPLDKIHIALKTAAQYKHGVCSPFFAKSIEYLLDDKKIKHEHTFE